MYLRHLIVCTLLSAGPCLAADLPDAQFTPGALNDAVSAKTLRTTVCKPGWARAMQPSAATLEQMKAQQMKQYGYPDSDARRYATDLLVPVELGGDGRDLRNVWPQAVDGDWSVKSKQRLENALYRQVCAHQMTLQEAQQELRSNWIEAYKKHRIQ